MATIERAIEIAARAHAGQTDKAGQPYILHPLRVMGAVHGLDAKIVAVLHDVVEDTDVTHAILGDAGFADPVLFAVGYLTRRKGQSYATYIESMSDEMRYASTWGSKDAFCGQELALPVKIADLEDNLRLDRLLYRPEHLAADARRLARYVPSWKFLKGQLTLTEYREMMRLAEEK